VQGKYGIIKFRSFRRKDAKPTAAILGFERTK